MVLMPGPETIRHQKINRLSDQLLTGIAEKTLDLGIDQCDAALLIHQEDAAGRGFHDPAESLVAFSQGRFRLFELGDIAKHTDRAERVSAGIARSDTGQMMDPFLTLGRMQITILNRETVSLPFVHLLALVQKKLTVVRMQMVHEELQRLEARVMARGNTGYLLNSSVHEAGAFTIVHFVVTEAGQFCSHRQPSLAGTKRCLRALAFGDVD
jgi:hypothetical protein